jgi:DNA-binding transcriptional MerR regulator/GGDEF domain-containing protein
MKMIEQRDQEIKEYLQNKEVQERIQKSIQEARAKATVTISQAAKLYNFSESQLREWEKRGLLKTERSSSPVSKGHRQYTPDELYKLAIIRELITAKYTPGDILQEIDEIWDLQISNQQNHASLTISENIQNKQSAPSRYIPIDQRVDYAENEVFWRYFTSQALRLSLMLICENVPDTVAGLVIPLHKKELDEAVYNPKNLSQVGEALIGWLKPNSSFYTFLDATPSFEVPSDFRIQRLMVTEGDPLKEKVLRDNTLIVVQRKVKPLNLSLPLVETIRNLLKPVYKNIDLWRPTFDYGMRDWLYQATDFSSSTDPSDDVLNDLMDIVIQVGGKTVHDEDRWRFCCLLLPDDSTLPLQHRALVVRAQSKRSPYKKLGINVSTVSSHQPGLSLRAYQSGSVIYRPSMSEKDFIIAYREQEDSPRSAIAIPIAREDGLSIAVLYIASDEVEAFSEKDRRVLRLIGKMTEELLLTYNARQQVTGVDLINTPDIVDAAFKNFYSENDFIRDLEELLLDVHLDEENKFPPEKVVSFIAIDIDNQSTVATKYGDRVARNLSKEVGDRIGSHLKLFAKLANRRLYHVFADRYYMLIEDMSLEDARTNAEQIRLALKREYLIDQQRISDGRPKLPDSMLELSNVTVRLGVTSYKYKKLKEVLQRFSYSAVAEVGALITDSLNEVLSIGRQGQDGQEGGNVIISWDEALHGYTRWSPGK